MQPEKSDKSISRIFFPGLDGLRFIAAALVIIFHVEWKRDWFGKSNFLDVHFFHNIGYFGVTLFFVLSGFLITYLILKEYEKEGTVNVPHFYYRRILRIWPLYFFIIITGFWVWPNIPAFEIPGYTHLWEQLNITTFLLYSVFLSSVVFVLHGNIPYLDQTWSVSVEEQFYLIWPLLIKFFHSRIVVVLFSLIGALLITKIGLMLSLNYYGFGGKLLTLVELSRFGCMATGGLAAYVFFMNKSNLLGFLLRKDILIVNFLFVVVTMVEGFQTTWVTAFLFIYSLLALLFFRKMNAKGWIIPSIFCFISILLFVLSVSGAFIYPVFMKFQHELISFPFALIILSVSALPNNFRLLKLPLMQYLGKISYGMYMYHNIMITLSIRILFYIMPNNDSHWSHCVNYILAFTLAIACSAISYKVLEAPFLKIKKKYTKIKSGALS